MAKESTKTLYRNLIAGHVPDHLGFYISRIMAGVEWVAIANYNRLLGKGISVLSTFFSGGCGPNRDSRVTLTDKVDALGMRRARLDWRLPNDFARTVQRAHEILGQEFGRTGLGRVRINSGETGHDLFEKIGNGHHEMGTTRMHRDPTQGVVDENCRVHGITNLFIAGSSVFPTYSFDNPTMTIVALALRFSDHLKTVAG